MIIGLTGGSGTGKSSASEFFRKKGFLILDLDKVSRKVCQKGEKCLEEIVRYFGADILDENGELIRRKLGDIVFSDREKLEILNKITHKYIIAETEEFLKKNDGKNIVLDAAVLFESKAEKLCTHTLCVLSSFENRLNRIMERDNISKESAKNRILSQPDDEFYISRCDYAVYNNSDIDELYESLKNCFGGDYVS